MPGDGMPYAQTTTVGATGAGYRVQASDNLDLVLTKTTGPGSGAAAMAAANPQANIGPGMVRAGQILTVPPSPASAPSPGGPAGNGVGAGSFSQPPSVNTRAKRPNATDCYAVPGGTALTDTMNRKQRKQMERQKASGR